MTAHRCPDIFQFIAAHRDGPEAVAALWEGVEVLPASAKPAAAAAAPREPKARQGGFGL